MRIASPVVAPIPWLLAAAKPRLVAFSITWAHGASWRTAAALPSVEPLSTTTASHGTDGGLVARERRQATSGWRAFQLTMTTETVGPGPPTSPGRSMHSFAPAMAVDGLVGQVQELGAEALEAEL